MATKKAPGKPAEKPAEPTPFDLYAQGKIPAARLLALTAE